MPLALHSNRDNTFLNNLGARTKNQALGIGSTDHLPSTLWITNTKNHFIGNVASGSQSKGERSRDTVYNVILYLARQQGCTPTLLDAHTLCFALFLCFAAGIHFELLSIRGDSALLPENQGVNPKYLPLYTFRGNIAHSTGFRGITTYEKGYRPNQQAVFEGMSSYLNSLGVMIHDSNNIRIKDSFFGYNGEGMLHGLFG